MLLDILFGGASFQDAMQGVLSFLILLPLLLISLTFHEYAHGYAAFKQGDGYAKSTGRLTLNPFKHIDPLGLVCMILVGFGWAKPVPVVPQNFRNGKKSMIIVASAGIIANLILAFIATFLLDFCYYIAFSHITGSTATIVASAVLMALRNLAFCNISLAVFNFLPVPPLDGYKIFRELFISKCYKFCAFVERYSNFIMIVFLLLIYQTNFLSIIISGLFNAIKSIVDLIFIAFR